jgi:hypothetical protein
MNGNVRLYAHGSQYGLDLRRDQWKLLASLLDEVLGLATAPDQLRLLLGVGEDEVSSVIEQANPRPPLGLVTLSLSLRELHALYALLSYACLRAESEEAFYRKTGYFVEHARGLAVGIEKALAAARAD